MPITELSYIGLFLPLGAAGYMLSPRRWRGGVMAAVSAGFMLLWVPELLPFCLLGTVVAYICAHGVRRFADSQVAQRALLILCLGAELGMFVYFWRLAYSEPLLLIMLAGVLLSAYSYPVDIYSEPGAGIYPFFSFLAYCLFFGKLIYGPLVSADEFVPQLSRAKLSLRRVGRGLLSLFTGLCQLLLLERGLMAAAVYLRGAAGTDRSLMLLFMELLTLLLGWYFRLGGCGNMAVGTGLLFGIDLPRNLAYPLGSGSFSGFFNRMLITQNAYARSYIAPVFGGDGQVGGGGPVAAVAVAAFGGAFLGLPMGAVLGGIFGLLIYIERMMNLRAGGGPLRRIFVFLAGTAFFSLLLTEPERYFSGGMAALMALPAISERAVGLLVLFGPLFIISLLLSGRAVHGVGDYLKARLPAVYNMAVLLWGLGAMALSLSAMIWSRR